MCHTKTPPIQGGALRVLPGPLAVPHGDPGAGAKAKSKARREFRSVRRGSWDPLGPAVPVGQTPQGRRTRMCAVFGRGRMPRPKIPAGTAHPPRSGGRTAGVCFFCLLFFAQAKKSRAPAASGTMPNPRLLPSKLMRPTGSWSRVHIALAAVVVESRDIRGVVFVAPHPNPSLPQGLPSVAAGRGASKLKRSSAAGSGTPPGTSPAPDRRRRGPRRRGTTACACVRPSAHDR